MTFPRRAVPVAAGLFLLWGLRLAWLHRSISRFAEYWSALCGEPGRLLYVALGDSAAPTRPPTGSTRTTGATAPGPTPFGPRRTAAQPARSRRVRPSPPDRQPLTGVALSRNRLGDRPFSSDDTSGKSTDGVGDPDRQRPEGELAQAREERATSGHAADGLAGQEQCTRAGDVEPSRNGSSGMSPPSAQDSSDAMAAVTGEGSVDGSTPSSLRRWRCSAVSGSRLIAAATLAAESRSAP